MAIKQTINYNSDSEYFAGFLQHIIDISELDAYVSIGKNNLTLMLDDSDLEALERFSQNTQKYLPHSIFLGDIDTQSVDDIVQKKTLKSKSYKISLCPQCLNNLTNPSSQSYLDDSIVCDHYSNEDTLKIEDNHTYSANYSEGDAVLVVDSSKINKLFLVTEDEIKALLSIEKPTIKVTIKDEELKNITGKNFINIKSPSSMKATLSALNAKESGLEYLFFKEEESFKVSTIQNQILIIKDTLNISNILDELHQDRVKNRFLNIAKEAGISRAIGVNLSVDNGITFLATDKGETSTVLRLGFFILGDVLKSMKNDAKKQKLLENFQKAYPDIIKEFEENPEYTLFESLSVILQLNGRSYQSVSDKSLEFHGNGGLTIDTFFKEDGFDYMSFLGSVMSFKLAGAEDHYIAYSIFEALGDMSISVMNQLKDKHKISNFIMMGSMFENSVLHSRIMSKFSQSNPYFSKAFALDD